jgi:predicted enzyme related to lactoylglutathione lyase
MVVGENGSSTMISDPGGAHVGAWQPNQQKGFEVTGEIGTPAWFELHTRAYEPTVAFYRDVFGWDVHTMSDTDEFRYSTLGEGEGQLAGIMDDSPYPGDEPAHWAVYFAVSDADEAIARIQELGGNVVRPAEDTPYGRLATVADPTGTQFRIVANNG